MGTRGGMTKEIAFEIEKISKKDGTLSAAAVLAWAEKHKDSKLHAQFVWDDTEAGRLYRLEQAGKIIRMAITVIQRPASEDKMMVSVKTRQYVSLSSERVRNGDTVYRKIETVISDDAMRQTMLEDAFGELLAFRRKYLILSDLAPVFGEIDRLGDKLRGLL